MFLTSKGFASRVACVLLALSGVAIGVCSPAAAWDSAYHTAMIQLTQNIFQIPGIAGSAKTLMLSTAAERLCYTERGKMSATDRVWLDLICGTDEPDHERRRLGNLLLLDPIFHNSEAEQRAVYEFNKAVNAYRDPRQGNAEAARHLGRSIHYLQDLTDISKHMSDGDDDAKRIRGYSEELAKKYLLELVNPGGRPAYPKWLGDALRPLRKEFSGPPSTPKEYLKGALVERGELAKFFKEEMGKAGNNRNRKRDEFIELSMLGAIIGQEQWISMYLRYIGVQETPIR